MGATYTRQSSSAIVDGGVIEASDINAEFNQILAAFAVTSGHTHDGTAAEGGPITKLLGTAITIGDATAGTDIALTFDGESNDGVVTWMEDEDYFQFSDDLLLTTTEKLQFRDTAIYINSSADGQLDLVADTEIQIAATTIDINGAVALNGAITGATNITLSGELDAATLDISGDADIDGTLEADAITINGTAIGSIYSAVAGSSSIVTTGALDSGSITSGFGTIDIGSSTITTTGLITGGSLDIDNVLINGTTIGHTDDTDLMTLSSGVLTVAGEVDAVSLDISGDADIDGTLEADAITINGTAIASVLSPVAGSSSIVTTGALDTGSITSGFGAIDNGTSGIRTNTFTAETSFVPDAQDGAALGTTSLQFSDLFLADGAVIGMGDDNEVTLTHVADTGILLNSDNVIQLRDSAINIGSPADGDLDINADDEVEINSTLIDVNGNLDVSGTLAQAGVATFALAANVAQVALSSSSNAIAWDASAAANAYHVTTENTTFSAPSNAVEGAFICVEINYNGSHTIAFNTVFEFAASTAPTTTDTDGKTDILVFRYNGAVWQEVGRTLNLSES